MGYTQEQAKKFIEQIAPLIQAEATKRGYRTCAAVIAQAIVESAAGTSQLSSKWHNYFGLKCGSKWRGASVNMATKEEYKVGTLTTIRDNFRAYSNMAEGVAGYYDFISTARYSNLKTATDYKTYATFLKNDGYATSSTYVKTLCSVVEKYGLTQYDKGYLPTLRKGSKGEAVRNLQQLLNYSGISNRLATDSIFGSLTEIAVIEFQKMRGLKADGIVGTKTWAALQGQ